MDSRHKRFPEHCGAPQYFPFSSYGRMRMPNRPSMPCENRPKYLEPATPEHIANLSERLSPAHAREVREISGLSPSDALSLSLAVSVEAYAYVPPGAKGVVFMMGTGEASPITGGALLWMLGSTAAAGHPVGLLRAAKWGLARAFFVTGADRLEQFIPDWYLSGLRFALRLGFGLSIGQAGGGDESPLWNAVLHRSDFMRRRNNGRCNAISGNSQNRHGCVPGRSEFERTEL